LSLNSVQAQSVTEGDPSQSKSDKRPRSLKVKVDASFTPFTFMFFASTKLMQKQLNSVYLLKEGDPIGLLRLA
jgi:hypothetical protein